MSTALDTTTLVLDARTRRIVHFTPFDPATLPQIEGNLIVSVPSENLPNGLKPENSYQFRYEQGQIIQDAAIKAKPQSLIDANRSALRRQLSVRVRQQWDKVAPWLQEATMRRSETFTQTEAAFNARISAATEQSEIDVLAQEIAAIQLA